MNSTLKGLSVSFDEAVAERTECGYTSGRETHVTEPTPYLQKVPAPLRWRNKKWRWSNSAHPLHSAILSCGMTSFYELVPLGQKSSSLLSSTGEVTNYCTP